MVIKRPFRHSFNPGHHRAWRCPLVRARSFTRIEYEYQRRSLFKATLSIKQIFNSLTYQSSGIRNQLRHPIRCDSEPTYSVGSRVLDPPLNVFSASMLPRLFCFNMYLKWRKYSHLNSFLGLLDDLKQYSGDQLCPLCSMGHIHRDLGQDALPKCDGPKSMVLAPMFFPQWDVHSSYAF